MRVAVCYSGQLRWARMVQPSQIQHVWQVLRDRYHAEIDLFVVSDRCNTTRSRTANGQFQWLTKTVPEEVRSKWLAALTPYVAFSQVVWHEPGNLDQNSFRDNLCAQFQKLREVWSQALSRSVSYDYVVRLRPDVFFDVDLQWPYEGELLGNLESAYQYQGDSVHIFRGSQLADVVRWCDAVCSEHFPVVCGQPSRFENYEHLFQLLCQELKLRPRFVPDMGCRWYGQNCRWFAGLDWRGFDDWLAEEYDYPFSLSLLQQALQSREQQLDWPEYCAKWFGGNTLPSEVVLRLWVSASPPRWLPADYPWQSQIFEDCVGLVPCAGTALRMGHLPKFLLPVPSKDTTLPAETLLQRALLHMRQAKVSRVWFGVSPANEPLVSTVIKHETVMPVHTVTVGDTATMSETVSRMLPLLARKFVLVMPDTYWISHRWSLASLSSALEHYPLAVMVWRIREDQFGKLGQCCVVNGEVVAHRDKDPSCRFEYSWGVIGWQASVTTLLQPNTPHVGYMLDAALSAGIKVGALVCDDEADRYFDCGTPSEYFRLIRAL